METNPGAMRYTGINEAERNYLNKRLPIVKSALEKMLERSLDEEQAPKIAIIGSGGGYRAMLCTIGSLCAAEEIGLLDATTYLTSLSGSTWAVAPWISTNKSIDEFKGYITECASKPFTELTIEEKALILKAIFKKRNTSPFTPVDIYGFCLANRLLESFGKRRQKITLSQQADTVAKGTYPYPIYTAIDGRETIVTGQTWYEFTPHTIGDHTNNIHIPTASYGSKFKRGNVKEQAYEKSLGYDMGTWGSAFGANIRDIIEAIIKDPFTRKEIEDLIPDHIEAERPLDFYAKVPNHMYKMKNINDDTLPAEKYMNYVDAGLEFNLPYPPVSGICPERAPEILIFLDASAGHIGNELKKVAQYAKTHNLPFPSIENELLGKETISIFKDEHNAQAPVVIYMPRISDPNLWEKHKSDPEFADYNLSGFDLDYETNNGFAQTKEFQYGPEHSTLVMNQTEFNMLVNKDKIIETIKWVIDRK
jgi:phospholipase A2